MQVVVGIYFAAILIYKSYKNAIWHSIFCCCLVLKFIYSEKATKFCEISTVDLSYVVPVKSTVEIL